MFGEIEHICVHISPYFIVVVVNDLTVSYSYYTNLCHLTKDIEHNWLYFIKQFTYSLKQLRWGKG